MPTSGSGPTTGHVVVCGLDHLGLRTIAELRQRDEAVVAIGASADTIEHLLELDVRLVVGDPRVARTLREAAIGQADVIVLTGDDDLANLNSALAATELNPRIRVVIRMFDQELGAHIPDLFPDAVALSSSALAAPGFVSAAIDGETGSRFRLAGRLISSRRSLDRARGPRSIPIARLNPDRTVEMLPDVPATDPDLILIDITEDDPDDSRLTDPAPSATAGDRARPLARLLSPFRDRIPRPERRLVRFAAILVVLGVLSAIFFDVVAGLTPLDAVSYVITLLFGASLPTDLQSASGNAALRVYAILLSLVGAALVAVVYAFITDALIR